MARKSVKETKKAIVGAIARTAAKTKAAALARKKKRGESLVALIERRKARIVEDFYDIGEALREISRDRLYEALGHQSLDDLLEARGVMSAFSARKLIAVVEQLPREQAIAIGQEKAYALVSYAAATPENDSAVQLIEADAPVGERKVSAASVRDVKAAASAVRAKRRAEKPKSAADRVRARIEKAAIARLRDLLRGAGIARAALEVRGDEVIARVRLSTLVRRDA